MIDAFMSASECEGVESFKLICQKCRRPTTVTLSVPNGRNELKRNCLKCKSYDNALQRRSTCKGKDVAGELVLTGAQVKEKEEAFNKGCAAYRRHIEQHV